MKKIVTILGTVLLLLVAAAAAAPFWLGMKAEQAYKGIVEELSKNSGVAVTTKRYERGWLQSTAETVISWPGVSADLSIVNHIAHGPFNIQRLLGGHLEFAPALAFVHSEATLSPTKGSGEVIKAFARRLPPLTADSVITLEGDADVDVNVAPLAKSKNSAISWRGLTGTIMVRQQGEHIISDLQSPGISISAPTGELSVKQLKLNSDASAGKTGYMSGNTTLHIGSIGFGPDIELTSLRFSTLTRPTGASVESTVNYQIKSLKVANRQYGPGQLTIVARKLDAAALRKFEQEVNTISKRGLPNEQASMMMAAETLKLVSALAKKAPELEVTKLSFKTPEGELSGKAKLVLDGSNLDLSNNMMLIVRALRGSAELSVPTSMVKAILTPQIREDIETFRRTGALSSQEANKITPAVMARIVDQAYPTYVSRNPFTRLLVRTGVDYHLTASLRDGQFLLNNQPIRQPLLGRALPPQSRLQAQRTIKEAGTVVPAS